MITFQLCNSSHWISLCVCQRPLHPLKNMPLQCLNLLDISQNVSIIFHFEPSHSLMFSPQLSCTCTCVPFLECVGSVCFFFDILSCFGVDFYPGSCLPTPLSCISTQGFSSPLSAGPQIVFPCTPS